MSISFRSRDCNFTPIAARGTATGEQNTLSRREFLQRAGLVAGGGAVFAATSELWFAGVARGAGGASGPITAANPKPPLPPHRAIPVPGIHAYADQLSVK